MNREPINNVNNNNPQEQNQLELLQFDFPVAFLTFNFITDGELPGFYNSLNSLESIINAITTEAVINNSFEDYVPPTNNKATEEEIREMLGSYRKVSDPSETECPICFDNYKTGEYFRKLPCEHLFHKKCVDKWFKETSFSCPICRTDFHKSKTT